MSDYKVSVKPLTAHQPVDSFWSERLKRFDAMMGEIVGSLIAEAAHNPLQALAVMVVLGRRIGEFADTIKSIVHGSVTK